MLLVFDVTLSLGFLRILTLKKCSGLYCVVISCDVHCMFCRLLASHWTQSGVRVATVLNHSVESKSAVLRASFDLQVCVRERESGRERGEGERGGGERARQ